MNEMNHDPYAYEGAAPAPPQLPLDATKYNLMPLV